MAVVSMSGVSFLTTFAHVTEMRPTRGVSLTIEPQFEISFALKQELMISLFEKLCKETLQVTLSIVPGRH